MHTAEFGDLGKGEERMEVLPVKTQVEDFTGKRTNDAYELET